MENTNQIFNFDFSTAHFSDEELGSVFMDDDYLMTSIYDSFYDLFQAYMQRQH
jgi:hypothetical protein